MTARNRYARALLSSLALTGTLAGVAKTPQAHAAEISQASLDLLAARLRANDRGTYTAPAFAPLFPAVQDPAIDAIVSWDRLRRPNYNASFGEIAGFLLANPGWPDQAAMLRRGEALATPQTPPQERIRLFERFAPRSAAGKLRLAEAYQALGRREEAIRWARDAWDDVDLGPGDQSLALTTFGGQFVPQDHLARADTLLWAGRNAEAERMLPFLGPEAAAWARARIALQRGLPDAQALAAAVPGEWARDPGLTYDRAKALNENRDPLGARRLMADSVIAPGSVADPVRWLKLRTQLARDCLRDGQYELGYRIADGHRAVAPGRPLSERPFAERDALTDAEWTAGWAAYKYLARPADAVTHFARYAAASATPTTRAKGLYWAARASIAAGERAAADRLLRDAALFGETFYGQLAQERLGRPVALPADAAPEPTADERARYLADRRVIAARMLQRLGDTRRENLMLTALAENAASASERRLAADLGRGAGHLEAAVIAGKRGRSAGDPFARWAFPVIPLPPELAANDSIVHAITRQESQFNLAAVSGAGARGLMQLMPATAAQTAARAGESYSLTRLTSDGPYNMRLGSAYYDRIRFNLGGSHVLAVAAYNAGPGNALKWVAANGDPRTSADVVEWIESIPFSETRNYVQRVLENAVVYDLIRGVPSPMGRADRLSAYLGKSQPG
jgi:soluble lytic murein transglycosylase